jgi:hypothetical protein
VKHSTGLVLRLLGPLIQLACMAGLARYWRRGATLFGQPVEHYFLAGFFIGLCLVIVGIALTRRVRPTRRPPISR